MTEHWEFALEHVREGFVLILGDDDALVPGAINRARSFLARHPEIMALTSTWCGYSYPELPDSAANQMTFGWATKDELRRGEEWLVKAMNFQVAYPELPSLYYSFVHTSMLDELRSRTGKVIRGMIPDVYSAIALAAIIPVYGIQRIPLCIRALSRHSNGRSMIYPKDKQTVPASFRSETRFEMHPLLNVSKETLPVKATICYTGDSLLQAQEAGLLPDGEAIAWNRAIAISANELKFCGYAEEELAAQQSTLTILAGRLGLDVVIVLNDAVAGAWPPMEGRHWLQADLKHINAKGVVDAAAAAGLLVSAELAHDTERAVTEAENERLRQSQYEAETEEAAARLQKMHEEAVELQNKHLATVEQLKKLELQKDNHQKRAKAAIERAEKWRVKCENARLKLEKITSQRWVRLLAKLGLVRL